MTVRELRSKGYKVRVLHFRPKDISNLGGYTVVQIRTPDGQEIEGKAICSNKENYNKKLGVKIAVGRALKNRKFSCRPQGWFIEKGGPCGLIRNDT